MGKVCFGVSWVGQSIPSPRQGLQQQLAGSEPIAAVLCPWQHTGQERASEAPSLVLWSVETDCNRGSMQPGAHSFPSPGRASCFPSNAVLPCCGGGDSHPLLVVCANAQNNLSALETSPLLLSGVLQLLVDLTPGQIRCSKREVVLTRGTERLTSRAGARKLYEYFSSLEGIGGFQDHFDW